MVSSSSLASKGCVITDFHFKVVYGFILPVHSTVLMKQSVVWPLKNDDKNASVVEPSKTSPPQGHVLHCYCNEVPQLWELERRRKMKDDPKARGKEQRNFCLKKNFKNWICLPLAWVWALLGTKVVMFYLDTHRQSWT